MFLGFISLIIGIIFFIKGFSFVNIYDALQQTVQYLAFVCGSIFIACSFICFTINDFKKKYSEKSDNKPQNEKNISSSKESKTNNSNDSTNEIIEDSNINNDKNKFTIDKGNREQLKERIRKITDEDCNIFITIDKNKFDCIIDNCTDTDVLVLFQAYYDTDDNNYYLNNCIDDESLTKLIHYLSFFNYKYCKN